MVRFKDASYLELLVIHLASHSTVGGLGNVSYFHISVTALLFVILGLGDRNLKCCDVECQAYPRISRLDRLGSLIQFAGVEA